MSIQIAVNTTVTTKNTITNKSISTPIVMNFTTSGSNMFSSTMPVTTSTWTTIDQNQQPDFLLGVFTNMDYSSSIQIAVGNTSSVALNLNTLDISTLVWSGSTTLYAKGVGPNPNPKLDYTLVAMN